MSRPEGHQELHVEPEDAGLRVDQFLARRLPELSRAYVQGLVDDGAVRIDGSVCKRSERLRDGDVVEVEIPEVQTADIVAEDIPVDVVYEDEEIAVVDKPRGLVVHPTTNDISGTLVNGLLHHLGSLSGINGIERPGVVHRIDKDTSGLLVVAKTDRAHRSLSDQFRAHSIERTYVAIVWGVPFPGSGSIESLIGRHATDRKKMSSRVKHGKSAVTHYELLEEFKVAALVRCNLETGRTHQIRVHLSERVGNPLVGDLVYGQARKNWPGADPRLVSMLCSVRGQMLHAATLGFTHPLSGEHVAFRRPPHAEMAAVLAELRASVGLDPHAPGPWSG